MDVDVTTRRISGMHLKDGMSAEDEEPSEEDRERFNQLVAKAKKYVGEGHIEKALKLNQQALKICYHEKLAKKIRKMEEYIKAHADDSSDEDDESGMMHLGKGFYLYKDLFTKLYSHQQEGVLWMWSLFRRKKGGILGDDMGLGKTIQVIGFLSGMFDMQKVRSVLIVLPVALMVNWEKEIEKWAPGLKVVAYHGSSKREKERALARVQKRGGICLTTYGLVVTSWEQLSTQDGREFVWDYMILDEGHKIKNPTKTSKGVHAIPANNRIILTGTPVQNNLKELWALFDFVHQGSLLGTQRTFKMEYDNPITRAREKDATVGEKKLGMEMAESLKKIIAPYFLRRTKAEVKERENKENEDPKGQAEHAVMPTMTRKNDLIVWTYLTETQLKIYQDFLSLDSVKELLMTTKSPLVALNVLKKICDHPRLLSTRACVQLGIDGDEGVDDDYLETEAGNLSAVTRIQHVDDNILINEAGKLMILVKLLDRLKEEGHRCLVFSQSRKMLDIMQKVITNRGHKIMRLDGTIAQVQEREQRIRKFQTDNSYSVFLLTTQVGGVGLTLTAADRVVIYDPSWNPATDAQAVDRVFRIGQDKNVVIYRLITCGTVEEKIYRRQVFKDSITKQTTGAAKNPYRYFSKYELKELFTMDDPHTSTTQQQLEHMHGGQRCTDTHLDEHIAFLYSLDMFGISDHDLMFSQGSEGGNDQDDEDEESPENNYIQHRVQKARELIQMESSQGNSLDERLGKAPSGGANFGGGGGPRNWDFPKPAPHPESPPVKEEIDLTHHSTQDVTVDLTSPGGSSRETSEEGSSMDDSNASNEDEHSVMDQSIQSPQMKQTVVDLTESPGIKQEPNPYTSTPGLKYEPMEESNSPFIKREPNNIPQIKREPIDLTSTPNNTDMLTENTESNMNLFNKRTPLGEKKVNTNLFGIVDSPDVVELSKSLNVSAGSKSSLRSDSKPIVEDSPNRSSLSSYNSNRTRSNPTDLSVNESMVDQSMAEESVIINDSVIMSDTEENDGSKSVNHTNNISVQEIRSILEKSLCSNIDEFNRSHLSSVHDSPVVKKSKRRSVCVRRVIESSDEEEEENQDQEDESNSASETEELENDMEPIDANKQFDDQDDMHQSVYDEHKGNLSVSDKNIHKSLVKERHTDEVDSEEINDEYEGNMSVYDQDENTDMHKSLEEENHSDIHKSLEEERHTDIHISLIEERHTDENKSLIEERHTGIHKSLEEERHTDIHKSLIEERETDIHKSLEEERHTDVVDPRDSDSEMNEREEGLENGSLQEGEDEEETDQEETEEELNDFESLSMEDQIKYNELVEAGRLYCTNRQYEEAQACVLQALEILPDDDLQATSVSLQKKILKKRQKAMMDQQRA